MDKTMKKFSLIVLILVTFTNQKINATTLCPESFDCNYSDGTCTYSSKWHLDESSFNMKFEGSKNFKLSWAIVIKIPYPENNHGKYKLTCGYYRSNDSMGVRLIAVVDDFYGSGWDVKAFNHSFATCTDKTKLSDCQAGNML
jgi:hypothetical protein